jgi:hypothetical protein
MLIPVSAISSVALCLFPVVECLTRGLLRGSDQSCNIQQLLAPCVPRTHTYDHLNRRPDLMICREHITRSASDQASQPCYLKGTYGGRT